MKKILFIISGAMITLLMISLFFAVDYFYSESVERGVEVELYRGDETVETTVSADGPSIENELEQWYREQEHTIIEQTSDDGLLLKASFIEHETSSGKAVILAHGYRQERGDMSSYVKFYYDQGFDILIPDARGHGESEGDYIGYGWHDRLDYLNWIDLLIEEYESEQIVLHGHSMGASLVLMASGEELPDEVKAIVADSGYTTVKEELTHQLKHLYNLPAFPLLDLTSMMTKFRSGFSFEEASAIDQVKNNTRPLLIIHGEEDELVPVEMAYELYEAAGGEKKLWIVPEAGHTKGYTVARKEYQERLKQLFDRAFD